MELWNKPILLFFISFSKKRKEKYEETRPGKAGFSIFPAQGRPDKPGKIQYEALLTQILESKD
jgi:hypothetical protein